MGLGDKNVSMDDSSLRRYKFMILNRIVFKVINLVMEGDSFVSDKY